jgi:diguanylate cyclase (GGDEF)-like protein
MYWRYLLVTVEIFGITLLNYWFTPTYYSFDVLYCLPIIQTAQVNSLLSRRNTDSFMVDFFGVLSAVTWSAGEAMITWPDFPLMALAMNIFTRSITLAVLGRILAKLWRDRTYARKDVLTDLSNRLVLYEQLRIEQSRSQRSGLPYSLMFIDIDKLKVLNDTKGHDIGDDALQLLADILRENSRSVDTICRFGGDEFVLLFPETDEKGCSALCSRITHVTKRKFEKHGWPISVSIGYTTEIGFNRNVDELLRAADQKMYQLKQSKNLAPQATPVTQGVLDFKR